MTKCIGILLEKYTKCEVGKISLSNRRSLAYFWLRQQYRINEE